MLALERDIGVDGFEEDDEDDEEDEDDDDEDEDEERDDDVPLKLDKSLELFKAIDGESEMWDELCMLRPPGLGRLDGEATNGDDDVDDIES